MDLFREGWVVDWTEEELCWERLGWEAGRADGEEEKLGWMECGVRSMTPFGILCIQLVSLFNLLFPFFFFFFSLSHGKASSSRGNSSITQRDEDS